MNLDTPDTAMISDRENYLRQQRLLVALHKMIAEGTDDSDEAMELREQLAFPAQPLSPSDQKRLDDLSGDLTMIHDAEIPDETVVRQVPAAELPMRFATALGTQKWEEVLRLLRADMSLLLKPHQVAWARARAFENLGELSAAIAMMDEATRRDLGNPNYRGLALELLWRDGQQTEAYLRAKSYLLDPKTLGRLVLIAGGILSRVALRPTLPPDFEIVARTAVRRVNEVVDAERSPIVRFTGQVTLGLLAIHLQDDATAERAFLAALDEDDATTPLAVRVFLLKELDLIRAGRARSAEANDVSEKLADISAQALVAA